MTNRLTITKLYQKAIKFGRWKGLKEEAEDFAGWLAIKWLEGKYQHTTLEQSLVDYKRKIFGNIKNSKGRLKSNEIRFGISVNPDVNGEKSQSSLKIAERIIINSFQEHEIYENDNINYLIYIKNIKAQQVYTLVIQNELTSKQAGIILGITEARISQILKVARKEIARSLIIKQMKERIRTKNTLFFIQWITL